MAPIKRCPKCEEVKSTSDFYSHKRQGKDQISAYCKACTKEVRRLWVKQNPEKVQVQNLRAYRKDPVKHRLRALHGQSKHRGYASPSMDLEEFRALAYAHDGVCDNEGCTGQATHLDHDHTSGFVRGFLCRECNASLGLLDDSVDKLEGMVRYLLNARVRELNQQQTKEQVG